MFMKIKCPKCNEDGTFSLIDASYGGPYRCWKCKALFKVVLANGRLESWEPLGAEEFERFESAKKNKYR